MAIDKSEMTPRSFSLYRDSSDEIARIGRALSIPDRVDILKLLSNKNIMSVNEIAKALDIPLSSVSLHVRILEDAGLVTCERMPSLHGTAKMCAYKNVDLLLHMNDEPLNEEQVFEQNMPLGGYAEAIGITEPCGMASTTGPIAVYNRPVCFYLPERLKTQVLWFMSGRLVYHFAPFPRKSGMRVRQIECSFEACAHAKLEQAWQTSYNLLINDQLLGSAVCTCETDGKRGNHNPDWWPDVATQYGTLFRWRVDREGCWLQGKHVSDLTVDKLSLESESPIRVAIDVPSDAEENHGINLFGSEFGNYSQALRLTITYENN